MAHISIHDSKQEWEGDDRVDCWVDFLIRWHGVLVNDHLEVLRKLVCLEHRRWVELVTPDRLHLQVKPSGGVIVAVGQHAHFGPEELLDELFFAQR